MQAMEFAVDNIIKEVAKPIGHIMIAAQSAAHQI